MTRVRVHLSVLLVLALATSGCQESAAPATDVAAPTFATGLFRVDGAQLLATDGFDGVGVDDDGGTTYLFDWMDEYQSDVVRLFLLQGPDQANISNIVDLDIPILPSSAQEGDTYSNICYTIGVHRAPRSMLDIATGARNAQADELPSLSFGHGGNAHWSDGWGAPSPYTVGAGLLIVGGLSGVDRDDMEGDELALKVHVNGDHRLIELPSVIAFCAGQYRFESSGLVVPGAVVEGSTFNIEGLYGVSACMSDAGGYQGLTDSRGSGRFIIDGSTTEFAPGDLVEGSVAGPVAGSATLDQWVGYMHWGLVAWPEVSLCADFR